MFLNNVENEYVLGSQPMPKVIKNISFSHVYFKYPNSKEFVINDVSFEVNENEKIALAGINGAGKSTLINLLLRFYEPTKGQILINGSDIRVYNLQDYWSCFSCMFQHSNLYNITLRENLMFGTLDKIGFVNNDALCTFLASLGINISSDFLNRQISKQFYEDGLIFSPGQSQKISVVRTLLNDAPVVVLDEPSSSMDALTEDSILETAFAFSKSKILFFISHRLSNLKKVDKIGSRQYN